MLGKTWHLLLLALMVSVGMAAQDKVEPLLQQFDRQPQAATANQFFDELLKAEFTDEAVHFPTGTPADSLQQQVWFWAAEWLYDQQQYGRAEQYALKALGKYHPQNPERADCLNTLGCIYVRMGDIKQAAHYARQSVEMELRGGDDDRISSSMNTLAGIYMAGYQAKEAEQIILQALEHANRADNPGRKAIILGMASEIYHTLGDDAKALPYAEQAYAIERQLGREPKMAIRLSQKGSALLGLHRYKEAEAIYREIAPKLKAMGDHHSYAIALNRLGMSLLCQKREREAIPYYRQAADLFAKMGDLYNEIHAHRGLYESYWKLNPDSAKMELDRFDLLKDSLYTHATAEALSRYNAEFGNDLLQQENANVRQAQRRTMIIAVAILLLVVLAAWWVVRRLRRRWQRQMQELVCEVEAVRSKAVEPSPAVAAPAEAEEVADAESQRFLMRVIEAVEVAMPTGNLGVEQVASALNMGVQTFRRRLQEAAGETPKAYIQAIQMERAVQLLADSPTMPISQIAHLCGFGDAASFSHTFKRIYGCSPSQYRG